MLPTRRSPNDVRGWVFWAVPEKTRHRKPWNLCGNGETRRICLALPFAKAYRTRKSRKCHPELPLPNLPGGALIFDLFRRREDQGSHRQTIESTTQRTVHDAGLGRKINAKRAYCGVLGAAR